MTDGAEPPKAQGLRDAITSKLRLGKGGNKAKRGSTPRTSAIAEAMHLASNAGSSHGSHGGSLESLSLRLRKLREAGDLAEQPPFRIKFVNHKNEATMADIYPTEEYKDIIRKVVEKLRMPHMSNYVLMYTDTDAEEIGVACTDNLREMFSIFEPGSKLQLKIVQQTINNSGALDSIPSIWDNGHTPNVFLRDDDDDDSSSSHSSESSVSSVDLGKLQAAAAAAVEMEEKPKLSPESHLAVEDVAEAAVAAAAASAAAAALADAVGTKTEKQENSNASNKAEPPTPVSPASPVVSPNADDKAGDKPDELRTAIAMMSNNLTLAIESLGTKLATNFDRLSNEQAKIIDSLAHAKTTVSTKVESKDAEEKVTETTTETTDAKVAAAAVAAAAAVVAAAAAESDSDSDSDDEKDKAKVEVKTEVKVETKAEEKVETKAEEKVETKAEEKAEKVETKTETKADECATETTKVEETKTTEIKVEDVKAEEKKEEAAAPAKGACDTETITVEVVEEVPPPAPAPTPAPIHVHLKKDECEEKRQADIFKEHLYNANAFAFHTNPYASSFFQHGFSEVGMPSYIRHPCMMQTPFDEHACNCSGGCSACLTRKLAEMGYGVNEMQVSSLLCVYNGDTARVIDHVTSC